MWKWCWNTVAAEILVSVCGDRGKDVEMQTKHLVVRRANCHFLGWTLQRSHCSGRFTLAAVRGHLVSHRYLVIPSGNSENPEIVTVTLVVDNLWITGWCAELSRDSEATTENWRKPAVETLFKLKSLCIQLFSTSVFKWCWTVVDLLQRPWTSFWEVPNPSTGFCRTQKFGEVGALMYLAFEIFV